MDADLAKIILLAFSRNLPTLLCLIISPNHSGILAQMNNIGSPRIRLTPADGVVEGNKPLLTLADVRNWQDMARQLTEEIRAKKAELEHFERLVEAAKAFIAFLPPSIAPEPSPDHIEEEKTADIKTSTQPKSVQSKQMIQIAKALVYLRQHYFRTPSGRKSSLRRRSIVYILLCLTEELQMYTIIGKRMEAAGWIEPGQFPSGGQRTPTAVLATLNLLFRNGFVHRTDKEWALTPLGLEAQSAVKAIVKIVAPPPPPAEPSISKPAERSYKDWILIVLYENGGEMAAQKVCDTIEERMKIMPNRSYAQWCRRKLIQQGLLSRESPFMSWKLTEEGINYVENNGDGDITRQ